MIRSKTCERSIAESQRLDVSPGEFAFGEVVPAFEPLLRAEIVLERLQRVFRLGAIEPPKHFSVELHHGGSRCGVHGVFAHGAFGMGGLGASRSGISDFVDRWRNATRPAGRHCGHQVSALLHRRCHADHGNDVAGSRRRGGSCVDGRGAHRRR